MKNSTLKEIASLLGQKNESNTSICGYAIDSREVQEGNLFFALPGKKVDGCQFLSDVAQKKAKAAIVPKHYQGDSFGLELIFVDDVRASLQRLAKLSFQNRKGKVIAITGSVGKTTTKEFIAHLLSEKFKVFKTEGNFNSQLTFPLGLLNLEGDYDVFVLEMGMTESGEIKRLVEIAPPDIVVITRIAMAHVGFFSDGIQGIAKAKAEILSHPKTQLAVIGRQAFAFKEIAEAATCKTYLYSIEDLTIPSLPINGPHIQENFVAAALVCKLLGMDEKEIHARAQTLKPHPLRFEIFQKEEVTFVKDCYNANPESMRAALVNLPEPQKLKKRIGILGSMVELGKFSEESHRHIGEVALSHLDELYCLGPDCKPMIEVFQKARKKAELISSLELLKTKMKECIQKGDVVLIKGSKVHQMWKLLED